MSTPDVFDALAGRLDAGAPLSWQPGRKREGWKKGDPVDGPEIFGYFVQMEQGETRGYGSADILVLAERGTGELRSVWLLHQALREKVKNAQLLPGDAVAIRHLGDRESRDGNVYQDYRFAFSRQGVSPNVAPSVTPLTPADSPPFDPVNE